MKVTNRIGNLNTDFGLGISLMYVKGSFIKGQVNLNVIIGRNFGSKTDFVPKMGMKTVPCVEYRFWMINYKFIQNS